MDNKAKRKQAEIERKRKDIFEVSERIFAEKGFYGTKMEDVAAECGHAVGALYKYFKSKDEIYQQVIHSKLDQLFLKITEAISQSKNLRETIQNTVNASATFFEANRNFFQIYVNEVKGFQWNLKGDVGNSVFIRYQDFLKHVEETFVRAINAGELRQDIQPMSLAVALVGMINAFFTQWVATQDKATWKLDASEISKIILDGFSPQRESRATKE